MPLPDSWQLVVEAVPRIRQISSLRGILACDYEKIFETPQCRGMIQTEIGANAVLLLMIFAERVRSIVLGEKSQFLGLAHNIAYFGDNPRTDLQGQSLNLMMINTETGERINEELNVHDAFVQRERIRRVAEREKKEIVAKNQRSWRIIKVEEMPPQPSEALPNSPVNQQKRLFTVSVGGVITVWSRELLLMGERWWPESHIPMRQNMGFDGLIEEIPTLTTKRIGHLLALEGADQINYVNINKNFAEMRVGFPSNIPGESEQKYKANEPVYPQDSLPVALSQKTPGFLGGSIATDQLYITYGQQAISAFAPEQDEVVFRWSWKLPRDLKLKGHVISEVLGEKDFVVGISSLRVDNRVLEKCFHVIRGGAYLYRITNLEKEIRVNVIRENERVVEVFHIHPDGRTLIKDGCLFFQDETGSPLEVIHLASGTIKTIPLANKFEEVFSHSFPGQQRRQLVILSSNWCLWDRIQQVSNTVLEETVLDTDTPVPVRLRAWRWVTSKINAFCAPLVALFRKVVSCVKRCFRSLGITQAPARRP